MALEEEGDFAVCGVGAKEEDASAITTSAGGEGIVLLACVVIELGDNRVRWECVETDGEQQDGTRPSSNQCLLQQHDVLPLHCLWLCDCSRCAAIGRLTSCCWRWAIRRVGNGSTADAGATNFPVQGCAMRIVGLLSWSVCLDVEEGRIVAVSARGKRFAR